MLFFIHCVDKSDSIEIRKANREAHLEYVKDFALFTAGPTLAEDHQTMTGSVIIPVSGMPPTLFASTAPERYMASKPMDSMSWALSALMAPGIETHPESSSDRNFAERSADEITMKYLQKWCESDRIKTGLFCQSTLGPVK